ncbi:MAG TPA: ABC transporter permease subunit [Acidimicrobiales bacterium]|nr:ABC transporter permease subunit [Acidimicrobiales bacterium]
MTAVAGAPGSLEAAPAPPAPLERPAVAGGRRWARRSGRVAGAGGSGLLLAALGLFILGPLLMLVLWAFASYWFYPSALPSAWTLSWWKTVLVGSHLTSAVMWSFIFAPVVTLVSAVICLPAAYAFARRDFPGKRMMMMTVFAANAFPKMGLYIAMASVLYSLHLMGTFTGVVVIQLLNTLVTMTWIPAAAFASVPPSLEEAARDAGASRLRVFWQVTMPLARPGIIVAMILAFLASLDEAQGTFLVGVPKYVTMPVEMYSLVSNYPGPATAVFAILLTIPSLVLLMIVRKHVFSSTLAQGYRLR